MQIRRAQKSKSKIRINLSGPSGCGKTYSALLLASGLAPWNKICIIDTENGSGELYTNLGNYDVLTLEAPFSPERYVEAIKMVEAAEYDVIIIDSVTHEWDGPGGILEMVDKVANARFKGNTWAAWSELTPRHQGLIQKIVSSSCHVITTTRAKTETIQEGGKVKKVGLKEIQREGFEYELTVAFSIDRDSHLAVASKDRTSLFINQDPFIITADTGKQIKEWTESGVDTADQLERINALIVQKGVSLVKVKDYYHVADLSLLPYVKLAELEANLLKKPDAPQPPTTPPTPEPPASAPASVPPVAAQNTPEPPAPAADAPAQSVAVQTDPVAPQTADSAGTPADDYIAQADAALSQPAQSVAQPAPDAPGAVAVREADKPMTGQIRILEALIEKRAKAMKKGYQTVLSQLLSKAGVERLDQLTKKTVLDLTKMLTPHAPKADQENTELIAAAQEVFAPEPSADAQTIN